MRVLHLADLADPIEVTGSHPIFSEDRKDFVPVRDLLPGERLRTRTGTVTIEKIDRKPGSWPVFNLEIGLVHRYYVSNLDVLAHNMCNLAVEEALENGELREVSPREAGVSEVETHHIATRYGDWGEKFRNIFEQAGMNLEDALNKIDIPGHGGPHGDGYNGLIYRELTDAVKPYEPGSLDYANALRSKLQDLRGRVSNPGDLMPLVTR